MDVTTIPIASAKLPMTYEAARNALEACQKVDECKSWADKAAALASYAKQADDDELYQMARKIQGRAVRRVGELLKEFDARPGNATKQSAHRDTLISGPPERKSTAPSREEAARDAGLTKKQQVTAVRVANVPQETFEAALETEKPASVSKLAEMGKRIRSLPSGEAGYKKATLILGQIADLAEACRKSPPGMIAGGMMHHEFAKARQNVATVSSWLADFTEALNTRNA